ncbi:HesA/MoeB/ThiF family protein [Lentilactobacillus farraginis]|uniref:HesA/MoeB/ThiF family protein n=1 Tax=Lentilactobacillus farraginis TaxID=390841 RepID=UPI003B833683
MIILDRYDRQKRVAVIGKTGQESLQRATILIAGVGALGSYATEQLARAGVGKLILIDPDTVSLTNLQRQALFTEKDATKQKLKVEAAADHLHRINATTVIDCYPTPLSADQLENLTFDLALDCLDNYQARDLLNRAAVRFNFDFIFASCAGTFGNVMAISPQVGPCLNCLFPNINDLKKNDCDLIGVNTALVPMVSAIQTSLAIKYLVAPREIAFNQLITVDNWQLSQTNFQISKSANCPVCQNKHPTLPQVKNQQLRLLCGSQTYTATLRTKLDLPKMINFAQKGNCLKMAFKHFLKLSWQNHEISWFPNGKVLLYAVASSQEAEMLFNRFDQAITQFNHERQATQP